MKRSCHFPESGSCISRPPVLTANNPFDFVTDWLKDIDGPEISASIPNLSDTSTIPHFSKAPSTRQFSTSRSSSPTERSTSDGAYRAQTFVRANIFVDTSPSSELLSQVTALFERDIPELVNKIAQEWRDLAQELVSNNASTGEQEWTTCMVQKMRNLAPPGDLYIVQNRDWLSNIKPEVMQPRPFPRLLSQKRQYGVNYPSPQLSSSFTIPIQEHTAEHATAVTFQLKDARPDHFVGIPDRVLTQALMDSHAFEDPSDARFFLRDLQDSEELFTDPVAQGSRDACFPLLIVENKSGATGGNLFQAQNQSAVSGSSALRILCSLADLSHDSVLKATPSFVFSVTTEGPVHELWLHFTTPHPRASHPRAYNMYCLGIYRIINLDDASALTKKLWCILQWGAGQFKDSIVGQLASLVRLTAVPVES